MLFDQPGILTTEEILRWYDLCTKSLHKEKLQNWEDASNKKELPGYLKHLEYETKKVFDAYFADCQEELDLSTILILIASAEGKIRLDTNKRIKCESSIGKRLLLLRGAVQKDWQVSFYEGGILEAWKNYTQELEADAKLKLQLLNSIGGLKEVLHLRHWVAHGRYWELIRGMEPYPPVTVARKLEKMYQALKTATVISKVREFGTN